MILPPPRVEIRGTITRDRFVLFPPHYIPRHTSVVAINNRPFQQFWVNRVKPLSTPSSPSKISSTLASSGMPESILAPGGWPPVSSPSDGRQRSLEKLGNGPEKDTNVARQFQSLSLVR